MMSNSRFLKWEMTCAENRMKLGRLFMPEMSGRETITKIRQDTKNKGTKIIFLTVAEFRQRGVNRIKELGVSAHVNKPIDVKILLKTIKKVLK